MDWLRTLVEKERPSNPSANEGSLKGLGGAVIDLLYFSSLQLLAVFISPTAATSRSFQSHNACPTSPPHSTIAAVGVLIHLQYFLLFYSPASPDFN